MSRFSAACLMLLLFTSACTSKSPANAVVATGATAEPAKEVEPPAPASKTQCVDDRGCEGYLRCHAGVCEVPPAVSGVAREGMAEVAFASNGDEIARYRVELAVEPWERTRGLMYRRKMDPAFGMLFVFDDEAVRSFWMKNTYLPLDMVHIDSKGVVVGVVADAAPMTTSPRRTGKPARYVLELVAGAAAVEGIEEGMTMSVENVPEGLRPE